MKDISLPIFDRSRKKFIHKYDNTIISTVVIDVFTLEESNSIYKKISGFYNNLSENFLKWANSDFEKYAKNIYISDDDPRKKFRFAPFEVCYYTKACIENGKSLIVDISVTVSRNKKIIAKKEYKQTRSLKNGRLIVELRKKNAKKQPD